MLRLDSVFKVGYSNRRINFDLVSARSLLQQLAIKKIHFKISFSNMGTFFHQTRRVINAF